MQADKYQLLLSFLIEATDSGKYDSLSFEEVYRHANAGAIADFLTERFGSDIDPSILRQPHDRAEINELWANLANAVDAKRKFGVTQKGMCLVMAYTLESLRQKLKAEKQVA